MVLCPSKNEVREVVRRSKGLFIYPAVCFFEERGPLRTRREQVRLVLKLPSELNSNPWEHSPDDFYTLIMKGTLRRAHQRIEARFVRTDVTREWYTLRLGCFSPWSLIINLLCGIEQTTLNGQINVYVSEWIPLGTPILSCLIHGFFLGNPQRSGCVSWGLKLARIYVLILIIRYSNKGKWEIINRCVYTCDRVLSNDQAR